MLSKTESGSILLFHNDLDNTTEALLEILTTLRDKGYEFITVRDLIYHENYSINADGKQIPDKKASVDITSDNVDEVLARCSDKLTELGFSEEQLAAAAEAVKNGAELPQQALEVLAQLDIMSAGEESVNSGTNENEDDTFGGAEILDKGSADDTSSATESSVIQK